MICIQNTHVTADGWRYPARITVIHVGQEAFRSNIDTGNGMKEDYKQACRIERLLKKGYSIYFARCIAFAPGDLSEFEECCIPEKHGFTPADVPVELSLTEDAEFALNKQDIEYATYFNYDDGSEHSFEWYRGCNMWIDSSRYLKALQHVKEYNEYLDSQ